ncbi:MAG: hypothetical protein ABI345_13910 [Jatrophihabitans sp.]
MKRLVLIAAALALLVSGCTSDKTAPAPGTRTLTSTETKTLPSEPDAYRPPPATFVKSLRPGSKPPVGEKRMLCPYIRSGLDEDPTSKPNVADIQGNRVGQTTVLTAHTPIGCRFYFAYDYEAVADIIPSTFATAAQAHNAMVLTAKAGKQAKGYPDFVPGVDGISYQTKFYRPDGEQDWAFVFAKGKVLVVVHTEEKTTSQNALYLAQAIVGKF